MINFIHSKFYRPEKGWDPIPEEYARKYAEHEWGKIDVGVVDELERKLGGFEGKRILDLGGGPGQYSVCFARRGADVTWHDISNNYLKIAKKKAKEEGIHITFSLGYLEEARQLLPNKYDLVFNRICWNYCINESKFADLIYALVAPGGSAYIDCNIGATGNVKNYIKLLYFMNSHFKFKVGHPYPPRGRIASLFQHFPPEYMIVDYRCGTNDRLFFTKSR